MEAKNQTKNINNSNITKEGKKPKGYSRFFRNVIKEKSKVLKDILQKRFFKWRKDALKGKIKKTVMIRISVSKEKEPKNRYLINKAQPKEFSKSVNKNDYKAFNINNLPKDINNIRIQKVENIENEDKVKENNKKNNNIIINTNNNINNKNNNIFVNNKKNNKEENKDKAKIYKKVNAIKNTGNKQLLKQPLKNQIKQPININKPINIISNKPKTRLITRPDNKINKPKINIADYNNNEIPKVTPKIKKMNQIYSTKIFNASNEKGIQNSNTKTPSQDFRNNNNMSVTYASSSKKSDNNNNINYRKINNLSEIPKGFNKKYEGFYEYTFPVKTVKIDLTRDNKNNSNISYNSRTSKRQNRNEDDKLAYNKDNLLDKKLFNNNAYRRRDNNNETKSLSNYSVKSNNDNLSSYSRSRKNSSYTHGPTGFRPSLKAGITTVVQHYSGQRKQLDNYDTNSYKNENRKNKNL